MRAARYGLPMMLAVIGGGPLRFAPFVDLYHRALAQFQLPTQPVGVHSPAHIAETDELAQEQLWPHYRAMMDRIGRERGWSPMTGATSSRRPARRVPCSSVRPRRSHGRSRPRSTAWGCPALI